MFSSPFTYTVSWTCIEDPGRAHVNAIKWLEPNLFKIYWSRLSIARAEQAADVLPECNEILSNTYILPAVLPRQRLRSFQQFPIAAITPPLHQLLTCETCGRLRPCGIFVPAVLHATSVGCETFVASIGHLRYVGPLLPQLVAATTWDLFPSVGRETFIASVGCLHYAIFVASVGCLRYMGLLLPQLVTSTTRDLLPLLRRLCYVHLFQTGLAQGHAPALLPDRSRLRARTCIASRQVSLKGTYLL